jgi:hypothetical protein
MATEASRDTLESAIKDFRHSLDIPGLSPEELLNFVRAIDCDITWLRRMDDRAMVWVLLLKPKAKSLVDGLGLLREVPLLISSFDEFQPRALGHIEKLGRLLEIATRFDSEVVLVLSPDPQLNDRLRPQEKGSQVLVPLSPPWLIETLRSGRASTVFRDALSERLYSRDLFDRTGPVKGRDFYGRDIFLQKIEDDLRRGTHVGLFGLRKVGKTSILNALHERQPVRLPGATLVRCDLLAFLPAKRTRLDLLSDIWHSIARLGGASGKPPVSPAGRRPTSSKPATVAAQERALDTQFKRYLENMAAEGRRLVIMLDEIERLFPTPGRRSGFDGYVELLEFLRGLAQSSGALSLVVVGVNPHISEAQYIGSRDNPMFSFFAPRYVEPLSLAETKSMIKGLGHPMGARFTFDAEEAVFECTGGHPFLARRYCSHVLRSRSRPCEITRDEVLQRRASFIREQIDSFAEMISVVKENFPEEFGALVRISRSPCKTSEMSSNVLAHLEGYQLVTVTDDTCRMRMDMMQEWLNSSPPTVWGESAGAASASALRQRLEHPEAQAKAGQVTEAILRGLIGEVEVELRRLVRRVLTERWGQNTEERIDKAIGAKAMAAARDRYESRVVKYDRDRRKDTTDILDYIYLDDLKKIVIGPEWQEFRQVFKDKRRTEESIETIGSASIELRHMRPLDQVELMRAYVAIQDTVKQFKGS